MPPKYVFGGFDHLNRQHYQRHPKRHILLENTSHDVQIVLYDIYIVKIGPPVFAQLTFLPNTQNPMPQKCLFPWGHMHPI